jgi:hypothetical protein
MGKGDRCCVGGCSNDRRYPDAIVKQGHVHLLQFHHAPVQEKKPELWTAWEKQVAKGRENFSLGKSMLVCSNHFYDGHPTPENPYPTLFLTPSDNRKKAPVKRKLNLNASKSQTQFKKPTVISDLIEVSEKEPELPPMPSLQFAHITRESDVKCFTGFRSSNMFQFVFNWLSAKASSMRYWKGSKNTTDPVDTNKTKPGPSRKLSLEQEFLLTMMRLRLALLLPDLAFRFCIGVTTVSITFSTWIKLMSKELKWLIMWPSKLDTRKTLPVCFRKWFPKVRTIIDCTEIKIETPSALDIQAMCWSNYKQHTTLKFLISISPCGLISFVSKCYGGRASDKFIVKDSGFYNFLEPYDQILADRGFKIKEELLNYQCTLAIPPSVFSGLQLSSGEVLETSKIANCRIFVEKAIARMKCYHILSQTLDIPTVSLADDLIITCAALCNLLEPLAQ